jgi:L-seryl-tRNA(Ser) seleniumtransferase
VAPSLAPLINATGVIVHTNLGRAPLSAQARAAVARVAAGYSALEYDLPAGERGSRSVHAASLLARLTGAEAAFVVNNNAAAVLLMLTALCQGREVIISRGQLVEIGGGFRVPDVMAQSGARLVEVGTTNRTHLYDYARAITPETGAILVAHHSNFKIVGFTSEPSLAELAALAREHELLLLYDQGSGALLDTAAYGLDPEPLVQDALAAGADLVTFSGDKLLGGPQAGILAGRRDLVAAVARHPLARAVRPDKLCLAALSATLVAYLTGRAPEQIPVWQMIARPAERAGCHGHEVGRCPARCRPCGRPPSPANPPSAAAACPAQRCPPPWSPSTIPRRTSWPPPCAPGPSRRSSPASPARPAA